ncbi:MAG: biopolymer transporter ExbD [Planctomycetaceae bacterium]
MSIEVKCPQCNTVHHVNDRMAGRRVRCPHCDSYVEVSIPEVLEGEVVESSADESEDDLQDVSIKVGHKFSLEPASPYGHHPGPEAPPTSHAALAQDTHSSTVTAVAEEEEGPDEGLPIKLKPDEGELDMTPMVDVTFLLLIFFMITAAFSLQKSIESPRQQSDAPSLNQQEQDPEELDVITVQIDELGSFLVLAPDWERETPGKQNLILALREAQGDGNNPVKLDIQVHEMAKLQALVDCMDAGTICDYGEVQVTQVDGFE